MVSKGAASQAQTRPDRFDPGQQTVATRLDGMTEDGPTGAATAVTSDCWPNLGYEVRSSLRCGIVRLRFRRAPQNCILPCSELPR